MRVFPALPPVPAPRPVDDRRRAHPGAAPVSTSLVGIPTDAFSTVAPPTIILVCHAFLLFGAFGLLSIAGAGLSGFPTATSIAYGITVSTGIALLAVLAGIALLRQPLPSRERVS
jgi:hypothetical protein